MIETVKLESQELTLTPIIGTDGKKLNLYKADSLNVIIGANGSGKTRALRQIAAAMRESGEAFGCHITFAGGEASQQKALLNMGVVYFTPIPFFVQLPSDDDRFVDASPDFSRKPNANEINLEQFERLKSKLGISNNPLVTMSCDENRLLAMLSRAAVRAISQLKRVPKALSIDLPIDDIRRQTGVILKALGNVELTKNAADIKSLKISPRALEIANEVMGKIQLLTKEKWMANYLPVLSALQAATEERSDGSGISIAFFKAALNINIGAASRYPKTEQVYLSKLKKNIESKIAIYEGEENWTLTESKGKITASVEYKKSKILLKFPDAELKGYVSVGWDAFSSGQLALMGQFTQITKHAKRMLGNGLREILLLIDEGDIFLHATWQRQYVELLNILATELKKIGFKKIQIILTTHSFSVVSDIPNQHILRLTRQNSINPRLVKSFAAAPQDVINSSFEANSIGSFAQKVLSETASRIKRNGGSGRDRSIISLIDDPILRREFERLVTIFEN